MSTLKPVRTARCAPNIRRGAIAACVVLSLAACQARVTPTSSGIGSNVTTAHTQFFAETPQGQPVTMTVEGRVRASGIHEYAGIPFAAPPVGALRFRHAQPKTYAQPGRLNATRFPAACPQNQGNPQWYRKVAQNFGAEPAVIPDQNLISEDCLYLNVWSPAPLDRLRAVMVWFHGGSNVNGWSHEPNYRGHALAVRDVVVVSIQYRVGPLGFLPLPFDDEVHYNMALSDQVQALRWVRDNIAQFGGDPRNVTVFGESSGGGNIAALMSATEARGLFRRAVIQSGAGSQLAVTPEVATRQAAAMLRELSIHSAAEARARPWQDYVAWLGRDGDYYHYPVFDGRFVSNTAEASTWPVDLIVGSNRHEMLMYLDRAVADPLAAAIDRSGASPAVVELVEHHRQTKGWSTLEAADFLTALPEFHCPAVRLAERVASHADRRSGTAQGKVFLYTFTRERPGDRGIRAYHGAEIPYVFDTHDDWLPTTGADRALTQTITGYWTRFARTGNPNADGLPPWPAFTHERRYTQELGDRVGAYDNPFLAACHRWWSAAEH